MRFPRWSRTSDWSRVLAYGREGQGCTEFVGRDADRVVPLVHGLAPDVDGAVTQGGGQGAGPAVVRQDPDVGALSGHGRAEFHGVDALVPDRRATVDGGPELRGAAPS